MSGIDNRAVAENIFNTLFNNDDIFETSTGNLFSDLIVEDETITAQDWFREILESAQDEGLITDAQPVLILYRLVMRYFSSDIETEFNETKALVAEDF